MHKESLKTLLKIGGLSLISIASFIAAFIYFRNLKNCDCPPAERDIPYLDPSTECAYDYSEYGSIIDISCPEKMKTKDDYISRILISSFCSSLPFLAYFLFLNFIQTDRGKTVINGIKTISSNLGTDVILSLLSLDIPPTLILFIHTKDPCRHPGHYVRLAISLLQLFVSFVRIAISSQELRVSEFQRTLAPIQIRYFTKWLLAIVALQVALFIAYVGAVVLTFTDKNAKYCSASLEIMINYSAFSALCKLAQNWFQKKRSLEISNHPDRFRFADRNNDSNIDNTEETAPTPGCYQV